MRHRPALSRRLIALAFTLSLLVPATAFSQLSIEAQAKIGVASSTIDDTTPAGDPVFDIGGGAQIAAMLRFVGGIAAGFNFNYNYDGHQMRDTTINPRPSMGYSQPSFGIIARYDLMPSANAAAWANYMFGSASIDTNAGDVVWGIQGFELGASVRLNYQLKPYKTYIIAGIFAYYQIMNLFLEEDDPGLGYTDMPAENMGAGATLGVRFDFAI